MFSPPLQVSFITIATAPIHFTAFIAAIGVAGQSVKSSARRSFLHPPTAICRLPTVRGQGLVVLALLVLGELKHNNPHPSAVHRRVARTDSAGAYPWHRLNPVSSLLSSSSSTFCARAVRVCTTRSTPRRDQLQGNQLPDRRVDSCWPTLGFGTKKGSASLGPNRATKTKRFRILRPEPGHEQPLAQFGTLAPFYMVVTFRPHTG